MRGGNIIAFDLIGLKDLKKYVRLYPVDRRGILQQLRIRSWRSVKGTGKSMESILFLFLTVLIDQGVLRVFPLINEKEIAFKKER